MGTSSPCGLLGSLRPTPQRTCTSKSIVMLGTQKKGRPIGPPFLSLSHSQRIARDRELIVLIAFPGAEQVAALFEARYARALRQCARIHTPLKASYVAVSLLLVLGCSRDRTKRAESATAAVAPSVVCTDSVEARAFACSGQAARRVGDTLFLRLTAGRDTAFINNPTSEAPGEFRYLGRIGHAAFHLVKESGHETSESWIFVNPRTGHTATALDEPHFSPDSTRFVTASLD
jgi:hypothetical protein